jgi:poly(3-hydroxybutyrate) depolymerase
MKSPATAVGLALVLLACSLGSSPTVTARNGRLTARPRSTTAATAPGFSQLSIGRERDAIMFVPTAAKSGPVALVVLLHGAGGSAQGIRRRLFETADSVDFAILIPDSRRPHLGCDSRRIRS